ncbi:MAG: hypothetical protein JWQ59_2317, partial [Cryobacterium sp.]|nr:hypothetical protein [Cryobacterium sp.]
EEVLLGTEHLESRNRGPTVEIRRQRGINGLDGGPSRLLRTLDEVRILA